MTPEMYLYAVLLFAGLFILGTLLCLQLYKWDRDRFFRSQLWVKIYYWIPIFMVFLLVLGIGLPAATLVSLLVILVGSFELRRLSPRRWQAVVYALLIAAAIMHLPLFFMTQDTSAAARILLVVGFSSVLSDVSAYFLGMFSGRFKLPRWINPNKSWDGVAGQVIGAVIGYLIILPVVEPAPALTLALVIGLASALGDLTNSVVKRIHGIKDWGMSIPGHGGVLDRFASLALAIATAYWWMQSSI